jgi:hypothetical protein
LIARLLEKFLGCHMFLMLRLRLKTAYRLAV